MGTKKNEEVNIYLAQKFKGKLIKKKSPMKNAMEKQVNIKLTERSDKTVLQQSIQDGLTRQYIYKNILRIM